MNTCLLVMWCNLAIAFGASINHQPRGLSAKPSGTLTLKTRQEFPSVDSAVNLVLTTIGSRSINDPEVQQGAKPEDLPSRQDTSETFVHGEAALKKHFEAMKKTMKKLQKSQATLKGDQAKVELEKVFLNANEAIMIVQAHSEEISTLTGVSKEELDTFFADLSHDISGLHKALDKSDHKLQDLNIFFAELIARISKLQISSENSRAKSQQVTTFFTNLISMISNLEKALAARKQTPAQYDAELKEFFNGLGANVANLEAQMGEQGVHTQSN